MDYFQDGQRERKKEKKKGTESLGKKPQKKPPQKFYVQLSGHFNLHTNENPPVLTALTDYRHGKKETKTKKEDIPS